MMAPEIAARWVVARSIVSGIHVRNDIGLPLAPDAIGGTSNAVLASPPGVM